jgi:predicted RNase H-like nuclease
VSQMHSTEAVGVDGCAGGWIAIVLRGGAFAGAAFSPRFSDLLAAVPTDAVVAVDIPIERVGIVVPVDLGPAGRVAGVDDVLDAAVAAWSAQRIARGEARCLPDPPERDAEGRSVAIWY